MSAIPTVDTDIWTDELYLLCPGLTAAGAQQAIDNTLREFCRTSAAFRVELWDRQDGLAVPFNLGADTSLYDFQALIETYRAESCDDSAGQAPYEGAETDIPMTSIPTYDAYSAWDVLFIFDVTYYREFISERPQGIRLEAAQTPWRHYISSSYSTEGGRPRAYATFNERPGALELLPPTYGNVEEREGIVPWVALGPARSIPTDGVPLVFERHWYDTILSGAAGRLMAQQDKPYTNPALATFHRRMFRKGVVEARDVGARQFNTSERNWRYPAWA